MATRRVVWLVLVAIVGFAATSWILHQGLLRTAAYRDSDPVERQVRSVLSDPEVDVLFVGTSRTEIMVDPDRFDAVMRAGGHPTHSYVAALPGMAVPEIEPLLRAILDGDPRHLKIVFIEPDFAAITPALMVGADRSVHFFASLHNTLSMLKYLRTLGYDPPGGTRTGLALNSLYWAAQVHLNIGITDYLLDPKAHDVPPEGGSRGYYTFPVLHAPDFPDTPETTKRLGGVTEAVTGAYRNAPDLAYLLTGRQWDYFLRVVLTLKERGLQVALLHAPQGGNILEGVAYATGYGGHCVPGVPLFDLSDPAKYPAFWQMAYRLDHDHLNRLGAPLYTAAIANKLLAFLARGAASACDAAP